jgi:hypothetical protein
MLFGIGGSMPKRRLNARCTAITDSVLLNCRTQNTLHCGVAILRTTAAVGAPGEASSGGHWKLYQETLSNDMSFIHGRFVVAEILRF